MAIAAASVFSATAPMRADRGVGIWLFVIAGLIGLMVVVGGLVRLTGSGLSITEWQPVTGAVPPLTDAEWQAEFAKYQGTPQYELINRGLGLAGFKTIYWWEWTHRLLGRALGVAFAAPFLLFLWQRRIDRALSVRLAVIFLLGGAQGALGWWMVQSGLEPARVAVSQYRLAAHLGMAIVLFGYIFWTALESIGVPRTKVMTVSNMKVWTIAFAALVLLQMLLGALMAGLGAGHAFSDWPTYGGQWIPFGLFDYSPWWANYFENPVMVHFQHRTAGYLVALMVVGLYVAAKRAGADKPVRLAAIHAVLLTALQIGLGVATVLTGVSLPLAAAHQICALVLFGTALWWVYVSSRQPQ
jgi:cytochrome c oxidase assembly protein subunit 15